MNLDLQPKVPSNLSPHAREVLERLRGEPDSGAFVLGGGVALSHYCEYRVTYDLDMWWTAAPDESAWRTATTIMRELASRHGLLFLERGWGDTRSLEWRTAANKAFSFQVSQRTVTLDPPRASAWQPVLLETFRDNVAAKMNALIARGAPRDISDIFELCSRGFISPSECWLLWRQKNPGRDSEVARGEVLRHLAGLETRRPLEAISNPDERFRATTVRGFLRSVFCAPCKP